jgi:hypothetical protein
VKIELETMEPWSFSLSLCVVVVDVVVVAAAAERWWFVLCVVFIDVTT